MKKNKTIKTKEKEIIGTAPAYTTNPVTDNKTDGRGNIKGKSCDAEFSREFSIENKK